MTYQDDLNSTNTNQSKIAIFVEKNLYIICQTNYALVKLAANDYGSHS